MITNQQVQQNHEIAGFLIYRHETDDFFMSSINTIKHSTSYFTKNPENAYLFPSEKVAYNFIPIIEGNSQIVPFYDLGDRWAVGFE